MRLIPVAMLAAASLISGCSIHQNVKPVELAPNTSTVICLIPALSVRESFTVAYEAKLKRKGFDTHLLPPGTNPNACPLTTAFIATWNWDMAMYMNYANIRVFVDGKQVGQAEYNAKRAIFGTKKFINAEAKIGELTDQLFPNGPPKAAP